MTSPPFPWPWLAATPLLLASGSPTRAAMLRAAGFAIETVRPDVDERAIDAPLRDAGANPCDRALALARAKALAASRRHAGRWILGADQTLEAPGHPGVKARDGDEARMFLKRLAGREHALHSAAAIARDGLILFECVETARLAMRALDEAFVDAYLARMGDDAFASVGGYRIEDIGVLLFDRVDGDHAVVLGLPLLAVSAFLRRQGALA